MNLFHRYIIRDHIAPFLYAFSVITFILILKLMLQLMDTLITHGVGILVVGQLVLYNLAAMIALVVPMSVLVATLMAFGRMGASGEIVAMKAAGISMYRIMSPILLLSIVLTFVMMWFNNEVMPRSNHRARSLYAAIEMKNPMLSLRNREKQFIKDLPGITLRVDSIDYENEVLYGVTLFKQEGLDYTTTVVAERGHFELYPDGHKLALVLEKGEVHRIQPEQNRYIRSSFNEFRQLIEIDINLDTSHEAGKTDRTKTSTEMRRDIEDAHKRIADFRKRMPEISSDNAGMNNIRERYEDLISIEKRSINAYLVEIHKKNSIPVAAIVFVMIGASLGILVRRSGASIGIGLSIGFFMFYYLFLIGGETLGDMQFLPPWLAMWLPNFVFGAVGIALMRYANRR